MESIKEKRTSCFIDYIYLIFDILQKIKEKTLETYLLSVEFTRSQIIENANSGKNDLDVIHSFVYQKESKVVHLC